MTYDAKGPVGLVSSIDPKFSVLDRNDEAVANVKEHEIRRRHGRSRKCQANFVDGMDVEGHVAKTNKLSKT